MLIIEILRLYLKPRKFFEKKLTKNFNSLRFMLSFLKKDKVLNNFISNYGIIYEYLYKIFIKGMSKCLQSAMLV